MARDYKDDRTRITSDRQVVKEEFTRQAEGMAVAPAFAPENVLTRMRDALGAPGGRLLDLACGPGRLSAELAPYAGLLVGADLTLKMVGLAQTRCQSAGLGNTAFLVAAAEELPFAPGAFDRVAMRFAIHHFPDPERVLREVRQVLRPEGILLLADALSSPDPVESQLHNALEQLRDPSHVRMWPEEELLALVAGAGFAVTATSRWQERRRFSEWAAIVQNARSLASLEIVMKALARAGLSAGIGLRLSGGSLEFTHQMLLIVARPR